MSYQAAGMQELITAIRNTGSQNIIMVPGIQYATSLVRWNQYKPSDTTGRAHLTLPAHYCYFNNLKIGNLAAAVHVYDFNLCRSRGCWDLFWQPVLANVPLIAGELGQTDCATLFIGIVIFICFYLPILKLLFQTTL